jgi:formylglycine-generating enzyme required for sulfatase activity/tRNA A-37 threonylcarbamoyl transferase component Bud32
VADSGATPSNPLPLDELAGRVQAALGDGYAIEGKLGAGGFAVVYLVRDVNLKRKLAVKVLSPDVISSHSVLERFKREAETVAQLSHPHIVPLHFIGEKDGLVYLVMQAIDGGSLADRLEKEKQLPIADAARIFGEVASALAHAHKRGVIHRDIKPQNVLIDLESGRTMVTDFGIARTADGGSLTATGMVVGTPTYLSPEQVTGEPSDHRADIYALGVMAYEMIAGNAPFIAPTPTAVLMKRLAGPPPMLNDVRTDVPAALAELVNACLAVDPNDRLSNAADVTRAVTGQSPVSGGHTTSARTTVIKPTARKAWPAWATMVPVIGGIALALVTSIWALKGRGNSTPAPPVDAGMAVVVGGIYVIGNNDDPTARPSRTERIESFGIERYEVTVGEYSRYVASRPGIEAPWDGQPPDSLLPVTRVRLAEAENYCAWRHPDGGRLPSESEWEAATRGTEGRLYAWGRYWKQNAANANGERRGPAPIGSYPEGRTPEGVYDLIGNVWEWTSSPFKPYADQAAQSTGLYVIRGGGFSASLQYATGTYRAGYDPQTDRTNLAGTGFRCVMPVRGTSG